MRRTVIILLVTTGFTKLQAQQRPATGVWLILNAPVNFGSHWQMHNDASYSTLGSSVSALQYFYRTAIRYNFNKQWSTAGGIAFFFTRTSFTRLNDEFAHEFRLWEEMNHQHRINEKLHWQLRLRAEQRFFSVTRTKAKFTAYRFRFRTGLTQKLNDKWSLQLADEYMWQQALQSFRFDQNRLMLSGIYHFNKTTQIQPGYMWLKWPNSDQHILTISFSKNFSFHGE